MSRLGEERKSSGGGAMSVEEIERELAKLRLNEDGTLGLRASVLNLMVVTGEEDAPDVTRAISALADRHPSRVIILISDPEGEDNLDISLTAFCSVRSGQHICSEQVTVHAEGPPALRLESIAGPLLIPDLPTFLFYPGRFSSEAPEFSRMAALADHVIMDSATAAPDAEDAFREAVLLLDDEKAPPVGDLQWSTLSPWRTLARDMFHSPGRAADLEEIHSIEVLHAPDGERRALLFAGWISSSLNWTPRASQRQTSGAGSFVFEFESGEEGCEIHMKVSPSDGGDLLSHITLRSESNTFEISRPRGLEEVRVRVTHGDDLAGESAARLGSFDTSAMLALELTRRRQDPAYAKSVRRVVEILEASS